ncbi:MAG: DUF2281 domain-containing protein [Thermoguttaceae bacterium]|jgi:hypothetical protein|nr:DUF2281 domain-containing protein [Thermoguttaceae bacterium]
MTTSQAISQRVQALPEAAQREVLDFVEFLHARTEAAAASEADTAWPDFSLASAMRGMEDEASPYTAADLKESF